MRNLFDCLSATQIRGLSEMLGFGGETPQTFLSMLRSLPAQPGVPMMHNVVAAYLDAVRERVGA